MVGVAIAFFVISSLDLALGLLQNLKAFVLLGHKGLGGAKEEFLDVSHWLKLVKVCPVVSMYILIYVDAHPWCRPSVYAPTFSLEIPCS